MQQRMDGTKICDIYDLQKCLSKLGLTLNRTLSRLRLASGASLRSCKSAGGGHFEHMLRNYCLFVLYASSEHFMKLSMCQCNLAHLTAIL